MKKVEAQEGSEKKQVIKTWSHHTIFLFIGHLLRVQQHEHDLYM